MEAPAEPVPHAAICVVDDDDGVRLAIKMLLLSYGWPCLIFRSAQEFLDDPASSDCACLITDLHMPGIDGAELLRLLRDRGQRIPAIVITAAADPMLVRRARACGICALLTKPFQDETLRAAVAGALAARNTTPPH
jgi:FixJ family two-component response regulator